MTDRVAENKYITYMMGRLPEAEKGEAHVMKKGESLWGLAKAAVGKADATNAEISEYMLLIAKTNGLDSYEKMNSIKANETIYMPKLADAPKTSSRTRAEESALNSIQKLFDGKNVRVVKGNPMLKSNLYHAYVDEKSVEGFGERRVPVMSFYYKDNEPSEITFNESKENLNPYGYDYRMENDGKIYSGDIWKPKELGRLSKEELARLKLRLEELVPNAKYF